VAADAIVRASELAFARATISSRRFDIDCLGMCVRAAKCVKINAASGDGVGDGLRGGAGRQSLPLGNESDV